MHYSGKAFSLEGFVGVSLGRFASGAFHFGFHLSSFVGAVVFGELLVGWG